MMDAPQPLLVGRALTRTLPGEVPVTLVQDASVEVSRGEFVSITGPSGSGKSSLLYLLGLLDRPSSGTVLVDGIDTGPLTDDAVAFIRLEKIGFVFQYHFLLPEFTVLENVQLPIRRLGALDAHAARVKSEKLIFELGLEGHGHKLPSQLSGGQRQRVALARALANDPALILADEPTGNLDSVSSATVQQILASLARSGKHGVVVVTHELSFAAKANRQIRIVDGKIEREYQQEPRV